MIIQLLVTASFKQHKHCKYSEHRLLC